MRDFTPGTRASRIARLNQRQVDAAGAEHSDPDAQRPAKRLFKPQDSILTFPDTPGVDPTNNSAERMIRPAVLARKYIQVNRAERGARTQAVLMSVLRTLQLRGHDPSPHSNKPCAPPTPPAHFRAGQRGLLPSGEVLPARRCRVRPGAPFAAPERQ